MKTHRYFPLFIDTEGARTLVIGGGSIARRRVQTLSQFGFQITVIADRICDEIRAMERDGRIECIEEPLTPDCDEIRAAEGEERIECIEETLTSETAIELLEGFRTGSGQIEEECRGPEGTEGLKAETAPNREHAPAGSTQKRREACSAHAPVTDLVLACTDDRQLNKNIGEHCREHGIPVNVCDAREESTFWFPAIALNEELTMGLVGDGTSHGTVRDAAAALREIIEERNY